MNTTIICVMWTEGHLILLTERVQERLQVDAVEGEGLIPGWRESARLDLSLVCS